MVKRWYFHQYSKLEVDIDCDVCIIGAGITGIMTAYRLSESGLKVVIIDKDTPLHLTRSEERRVG